jgi:hypothetical protein
MDFMPFALNKASGGNLPQIKKLTLIFTIFLTQVKL